MRYLDEHKVNPANDTLILAVLDEPGSGGACHQYRITSNDAAFHVPTEICFQNGPINDVGVNGLTHEALLAVLCDRMRGFQSGPYASADNAEALACMEQAQAALQRRTRARMARGVEGTNTV
jgi:hypothetical protein